MGKRGKSATFLSRQGCTEQQEDVGCLFQIPIGHYFCLERYTDTVLFVFSMFGLFQRDRCLEEQVQPGNFLYNKFLFQYLLVGL